MSANFIMISGTTRIAMHEANYWVWARGCVCLSATPSRNCGIINPASVISTGTCGVREIDNFPTDWEGAGILGEGGLSRKGEGERGEKSTNKHNSNLPDFFKLLLWKKFLSHTCFTPSWCSFSF